MQILCTDCKRCIARCSALDKILRFQRDIRNHKDCLLKIYLVIPIPQPHLNLLEINNTFFSEKAHCSRVRKIPYFISINVAVKDAQWEYFLVESKGSFSDTI